jgi:hypothetical protein
MKRNFMIFYIENHKIGSTVRWCLPGENEKSRFIKILKSHSYHYNVGSCGFSTQYHFLSFGLYAMDSAKYCSQG